MESAEFQKKSNDRWSDIQRQAIYILSSMESQRFHITESLFKDCRKCNGHIGVPITFLSNHCEDQFTIIGLGTDVKKTMEHVAYKNRGIICYEKNGVPIYTFPYTVSERKIGNSLRFIQNGKPGPAPYNRILIQRKPTKE